MIKGLDLFSGIGGISLALKDIVKPIAYVEIDDYCQKVLKKNMKIGHLHEAEIFGDVKEFKGEKYNGKIDIIYGGFPCQDISCSNANGKGLGGERSGLFREIVRLTKETKAPFVFLENVPAIRLRGLLAITEAFTNLGYDCRWTIVSAKEVGAPHLRKRWFFLAHAKSLRLQESGLSERKKASYPKPRMSHEHNIRKNRDEVEYILVGRNHGISNRVDRVKGLGNAVVPLQTRVAFEKLLGLTNETND